MTEEKLQVAWFISPESTTPEHAEDVAKWAAADNRPLHWHIECKTLGFYNNFQKHVKSHGNWTFVRVTGKDSSTKPLHPVQFLVSVKESELQASTDLSKKIRLRKRAFGIAETLYWNWQLLSFQPMAKVQEETTSTGDLAFSFSIKTRKTQLKRIGICKTPTRPYYPILNATSQAYACVVNITDEEIAREKEKEDEMECFVPQLTMEPIMRLAPEAVFAPEEELLPPVVPSLQSKAKRLQVYEYPM